MTFHHPANKPCKGITIAEAMERLGYCRATVRRLIDEGELIAYGRHKRIRIEESSIEDYKQRNQMGIKEKPKTPIIPIRTAQYQQAIHDLRAMGVI